MNSLSHPELEILRYAPDVIFITEANGQIIFTNDNDNASHVLGYSEAELLNMTVLDISPVEWREKYRLGLDETVADGERHTFEIRLICKNGKKIPMELLLVRMPNGLLFGSCRDISERILADKKILAANKQLTDLINALPDAIFFKDGAGRWLITNQPAQQLFCLEQIDWQGKTDQELTRLNPQLREAHEICVKDDELAWQVGKLSITEEIIPDTQGKLRNFEVFKLPHFDTHGKREGLVVIGRDITERKLAEKNIHELAFYDPLTKLPNRRLLLDRLTQALLMSEEYHRYGALLVMDLDHFKSFSTKLGDAVLKEVAQRLQSCVPPNHSLACLGGDRFVILIEPFSTEIAATGELAEMLARKISTAISQPYSVATQQLRTSASIGIALFSGRSESADDLLKQAKAAVDLAKKAGRNCVKFFNPALQAVLLARSELEHELRIAIEQQQFTLHYQIQVDSNHRAVGAEVLVRWNHPKRGLIPPAQFIPLCEEIGLIVPLGLWVLEQAALQVKTWQKRPHLRDLVLAVNVSAKQLHEAGFVEHVQKILLATGAKSSQLKLELTESSIMENITDTIGKMRELQLLGLRFSMDDFGTGHSSLQYLKRLPLDQIKIDQSFVRDIATDPNDAVIVKTIISMSDALGLNVIAEGVETELQQAFLEAHGCHIFQGYLFGKPLPIDDFEAALQQHEIKPTKHL